MSTHVSNKPQADYKMKQIAADKQNSGSGIVWRDQADVMNRFILIWITFIRKKTLVTSVNCNACTLAEVSVKEHFKITSEI